VRGGDQIALDLRAIDGCWEIRRFLARVARESSEGDWSDEEAELIGRARTDLVTQLGALRLVAANDWPTSTRLIIERLLGWLVAEGNPETALALAEALTELDSTPGDRAAARQALLDLLVRKPKLETALKLAKMITHVTAGDRAAARHVLLDLLARKISPETALVLAGAVTCLTLTPEEQATARQALLDLLASESRPGTVRRLAKAIAQLNPGPEDRASG
jgi:hypothetical protein